MRTPKKLPHTHSKVVTIEDLPLIIPKYSYTFRGKQMEPINLILLGKRRAIDQLFTVHSWHKADKLSLKSLSRALWATLLNRGYVSGPMSPSYIKRKHYQLAVEHSTQTNTFRRRHHVRIWNTGYRMHKLPVWIGTASYDRSIGFYKNEPIPTHHIAPSLTWEEEFLAHSLGIAKPSYIRLGKAEAGQIATGDDYTFSGRALIVDLSKTV